MTAAVDRAAAESFRDLISRNLGLSFEDARLDSLADVLRQRLDALGLPVAAPYLDRLRAASTSEEWLALAGQLTVGETFFFRNPDHFRAFAEEVLPFCVRSRASDRRLRLLSAGCATGEEAYTLAMLVREHLPDRERWNVRIQGLDINPIGLAKAREARYSSWSLRGTPETMRERYFRSEGRDFVLSRDVRDMVTFENRNLAAAGSSYWATLECDVVFCRNVIMYLTPEAMRDVVQRLSKGLVPGGYLFLGHAETLRGLSQQFHLRHTHDTFYYQRKDRLEERDAGLDSHPPAPHAIGATGSAGIDWAATWIETVQRSADRIQALAEGPVSQAPAQAPRPPRRADIGAVLELLKGERFEDALDLLGRMPPDTASDPDVLLLRAVLLTHAGQIDAAERVCARLLSIDELNAGAHYVLALCREGASDAPGAREHDQSAAYLDPSFGMPRLHLGLMARRAGDRERALRELGQAVLLLQREDASRLLLFGGGFSRETLIALCRSELTAAGGRS